MDGSLFKSAVWQLVCQMDWLAICILIGLFCLSVLCTAIMACKFWLFYKQRQHMNRLWERLRHAKSFSEVIALSKEFKDCVGGKLLMRGLSELRQILDIHNKKKNGQQEHTEAEAVANVSQQEFEQLEFAMEQAINSLVLEEEAYLPVLGSCAAASPLIGLFGTIWGLIHAFIDISQEKTADIATVAPGMAEALIVTLAGLVVAIPALVAFHYFTNEIRKLEFRLTEICDKFLNTAKQTFVK